MRAIAIALALLLALAAPTAVLAGTPKNDLCPNLKGMQREVPDGYVRMIGLSGWECVPTP